MRGVAGAIAVALGLAGCARPVPPPEPQPDPPPAAPPTTRALAPRAVAGSYQLRYELLQGPGQRRGQRAQSGRAATGQLRLDDQPAAVIEPDVASSVQFGGAVQLPGYTRSPRGRSAQTAVWYPAPGDSIVIQFTAAQGGQIQLRGALRGQALRGDIWYTSSTSGSSFQLGTFTATRSAGRRLR